MPAPSILPLINAAALALAIVSLTLSLVPRRGSGRSSSSSRRSSGSRDTRRDIAELPLEHSLRTSAHPRIGFRRERGRPGRRRRRRAGARRALREAFAAYLADRRRARRSARPTTSAARRSRRSCSVLDLAEAHHARAARRAGDAPAAAGGDDRARRRRLPAREPLDVRDRRTAATSRSRRSRGIEHEYVEQLRALADASVAINSSLTVEEILQLTADAARAVARRAARATIAILAAEPRRPPLGRDLAAASSTVGHGDAARARRRACRRAGSELGIARGRRRARSASSPPRDEAILTQLGQLASVAIANAQLYDRERTIARTLQRSLRPGALPPVPGLVGRRALPPRRRGHRARRRLLRPLPRPATAAGRR